MVVYKQKGKNGSFFRKMRMLSIRVLPYFCPIKSKLKESNN
jgi:hypothetical protein